MVGLQAAAMLLAITAGGDTVLLDFSASWCGPCQQMQPIVHELQSAGYPVRQVDIDQEPALKSQYNVTGVPCFVMLVGGQEVGRIVGATSRGQLEQLLQAARTAAPAVAAAPARSGLRLPALLSEAPLISALTRRREQPTPPPALPLGTTVPVATPQPVAPTSDLAPPDPLVARLLSASVRLRIDDEGGRSVGSGTIIDSRDGEALIVTCGHVFRESQGKGRVLVDLFGPAAEQNIEGRVVSYDLKSDVGLVSIRMSKPVTVARLAPAGFKPAVGTQVVSVGCDHGADPTARVSRVTSLDKYMAPPNLQVAGQPVEGRSGGGLFTRDGYLVGICNAADPADDEGLFAAQASIAAELERIGIADLLQTTTGSALVAAPPAMPRSMPSAVPNLSRAERDVVDQLSASGSAEVICIVRPLDGSAAKSRVIVLDQASPQFLEELAAAERAQDGRHLTSFEVPVTKVPATPPQSVPSTTQQPWKPHPGP